LRNVIRPFGRCGDEDHKPDRLRRALACGNATLASLIQNLSSGTLRARMWQALVAEGAQEATRASHRAIYDALLACDSDLAAAADLMHLAIAEKWLRQLLDSAEKPS
jgi:GntR family transcriptional repressor for pyruvate dehydrogenase complex